MIDWTGPKTEPPVTMDLTELEILEIIERPLVLPPFPCHTLDVERMVPVVTESALHRIGPVNRHRQYITAVLLCPHPKIISHKLFSGGLSKLWNLESCAQRCRARKMTPVWTSSVYSYGRISWWYGSIKRYQQIYLDTLKIGRNDKWKKGQNCC